MGSSAVWAFARFVMQLREPIVPLVEHTRRTPVRGRALAREFTAFSCAPCGASDDCQAPQKQFLFGEECILSACPLITLPGGGGDATVRSTTKNASPWVS